MKTPNRRDDAKAVAQALALAASSEDLLQLLQAALHASGKTGAMLAARAHDVVAAAQATEACPSRYLVIWTIDIDDADSPREAAEWAHECQIRPGTTATCFTVVDNVTGVSHEVDLDGDTPIPVRLTSVPFEGHSQDAHR